MAREFLILLRIRNCYSVGVGKHRLSVSGDFITNVPVTPDLDPNAGIHHPKFGQVLKEKMDELGVECIVRFREDLPGLPQNEIGKRFHGELVEFVKRHFRM